MAASGEGKDQGNVGNAGNKESRESKTTKLIDLVAERQRRYEDANIGQDGERFHGVWASTLTPQLNAGWLIKNFLPSNATGQIYGASSSGKTAVTLDIACHIASGTPWRGRKVKQCPVLYFAIENPRSVQNRIVAWSLHNGIGLDEVPLLVVPDSLSLLNGMDINEIVAYAQSMSEPFGGFGLTVFDTQARAIAGGDENSFETASRLVAGIDQLRDKLNTMVLLIHHSGKDVERGSRGHSSVFGAVDFVAEVADRRLVGRKVRDGDVDVSFDFGLRPVSLGQDEDGDEVTAVVAVDEVAVSKQPTLPHIQSTALTALKSALESDGEDCPGTSALPKGRVVKIEIWRKKFYQFHAGEAAAKRVAWNRAWSKLCEMQLVGVIEPYAWLNKRLS